MKTITLKKAYEQATEGPLKVEPCYVPDVAKIITPDGHKFIEMGSVNCALLAHAFNVLPGLMDVLPEVIDTLDATADDSEEAGFPGRASGARHLRDTLNKLFAKANQVEVP